MAYGNNPSPARGFTNEKTSSAVLFQPLADLFAFSDAYHFDSIPRPGGQSATYVRPPYEVRFYVRGFLQQIYIYIYYIYKHVRWPWLTPTQLRVSCVMNILTRNHMKPLQGEPAEHDSCKPIAKAANVIELRYKALCNIVHRHVALGRAETVEPRDDCHQETSTDPFSEHPKPSTIWRDGRNHAQQWGPHFYQAAKIEISPRARCKRDAFRSSQERFIAHRFHLTQQVLHMLLEKCESQ